MMVCQLDNLKVVQLKGFESIILLGGMDIGHRKRNFSDEGKEGDFGHVIVMPCIDRLRVQSCN
jgi:hypothetical protein